MRKRTDGFTLVELMVAVLILGILVAVAVPVFRAARAQAAANTCKANQRILSGAVEAFKAQNPNAGGGSGYDWQWGFITQKMPENVWPYHAHNYAEGLEPNTDSWSWSARLIPKYVKSVPLCPDAPAGGPSTSGPVSTSWYMSSYEDSVNRPNESSAFTGPTAVYYGYCVTSTGVSTCCWGGRSFYRRDHSLLYPLP